MHNFINVECFPSILNVFERRFCLWVMRVLTLVCIAINVCAANEGEENVIVSYLAEKQVLQGKAEIVFLLDRSGSVGAANFEIEKGFVESFLTHIVVDVNASRVAVISYSDSAVLHINYLSDPKTKCFLSQEMQEIVFKDSGATNTGAALNLAYTVFENARPNVPKVLILISDGFANIGVHPEEASNRLKETGVEIFCFGIGKSLQTELEALASSRDHVLSCREFRDFKRLAKKIRGDPHEISWSGQASQPNCDHLCDSPYKGDPNDPGCCDHSAKCSCALRSGMHTCVCGPGYYGYSGLHGHCTACPIGTFKSKLEPAKQCTSCPPGSTTQRQASTGISNCTCKEGYVGNPGKGINCTLIKCPPLQKPSHGSILGTCGVTYWSDCAFMCDEGYEMLDKRSRLRTCPSNGTWSGRSAICQRIRCSSPPVPQFGKIERCESRDLLVGVKCRYRCYHGYIMEGSKERQCLSSKKWSGTEVKCIPVNCNLPPKLQYGFIYGCKTNKRPEYGETCAFKCNSGFELKGTEFAVCLMNGKLMDVTTQMESNTTCVDVTPPEITCPASIAVDVMPGSKTAEVNWKIPEPTDNTGLIRKFFTYPENIVPPFSLGIGKTTIQYIAIDISGLKSACNFDIVVFDNEPPRVLRCPPKITVASDYTEEPVFWEEPLFQDNSGEEVEVFKSASPGEKFGEGRHTVIYRAVDPYKNEINCIFEIIMTRNTCPYYPPPVNGAFTCDDFLYGRMCQAYCNERYDFVEKPADWYACNGESQWVTLPANQNIPWPDCASLAIPGRIRQMLKGFYYQGDCNDPEVQMYIKKRFLHHLTTEFEKAELCYRKGSCNLQRVRVLCGKTTDHVNPKRFRRDVWEHAERESLELEFEITIDSDQELNDTEAVLQNFLETIEKLKWDIEGDFFQNPGTESSYTEESFWNHNESFVGNVVITDDETHIECNPGSVQNNDICIFCAPGTFYEASMKECWDCPLGHFQEYEGQFECDQCPKGMSTEFRRSRNQTDCKDICQPGTYSQTGLETCLACPMGTYQEDVGQHACATCPNGTTTSFLQASSLEDCKDLCKAGSYSETGLKPCNLCPKGFYQPLSGQSKCMECPQNFTTIKEGASSSTECLDLDPCSDVTFCLNGGRCHRQGKEASCTCKDGFEDRRCGKDINECSLKPCFNDGECVNVEGSFYCNCTGGFSGALCETEINECLSYPCMNNGTCMDEVNDYACICLAGYEGRNCDIVQEVCFHDIICLNEGLCVFEDGSNESFCSCPPGYSGIDCSLDIDECENVTCLNNGRCIDKIAGYECACSRGFTGKMCETDMDDCLTNECASGSTCVDLIGAYRCQCQPGWGGAFCQNKLDPDFVLSFPQSTATIANMATTTVKSPLSDVTISMWVQTTDTEHSGTPISYAVASAGATHGDGTVVDNALTISDCSGINVYVNNEPLITDVQVADGLWHHLAFTWSSENSGTWNLYKDGEIQSKGSNLRPNDVIASGGSLVIGQEQDAVGGEFNPLETFTGNITRVNIWNSYFSRNNITRLCSLDDDLPGKVVAWPDFLEGVKGDVNIIQNQRPSMQAIHLTNDI